MAYTCRWSYYIAKLPPDAQHFNIECFDNLAGGLLGVTLGAVVCILGLVLGLAPCTLGVTCAHGRDRCERGLIAGITNTG